MADVVNTIPLIPYDRPDWVVQKEKYNRYKIVNYKAFKNRKQGTPRSGKTIFVYDHGNSLSVIRMEYFLSSMANNKSKANFRSSIRNIYRLKIKDGRLVIWNIEAENGKGITSVRNKSNNVKAMKDMLLNFGQKNYYGPIPLNNRTLIDESTEFDELRCSSEFEPQLLRTETRVIKSIEPRLNKILVHFLRRNNIKFKYTKDFWQNLRTACYPVAEGFELKHESLSSFYSRYLFKDTIKYTIKKCFGHDSSKLVGLVCEQIKKDQSFDCLLTGLLLKNLVPLDYLHQVIGIKVQYLASLSNLKNSREWLQSARKLLKNFNAARILKLILAEDFSAYYFNDSVNMYADLGFNGEFIKKPKNWHEIHEFLRPIKKTINSTGFELPIRKKFKEIDGAEVEDLKLEVPNHTDKLNQYSKVLHHCISSYGNIIKSGYCDVLAVYRNSDLLYNISIKDKSIEQFRGLCNCDPSETDRKKVVDFLTEKGVLKTFQAVSSVEVDF